MVLPVSRLQRPGQVRTGAMDQRLDRIDGHLHGLGDLAIRHPVEGIQGNGLALAFGQVVDGGSDDRDALVRLDPRCRKRLDALRDADAAVRAWPRHEPSAGAVLAARRALAEEIRRPASPEILTLEDIAEILRVTPAELSEVVDQLPAFELAGQIRVRRARLIEWIRRRERDYTRQAVAHWAARERPIRPQKGVLR